MSEIWNTKKWSLGPLLFDAVGGFTTEGIGSGNVPLTRTIPFRKKDLGFDPRLLKGSLLKIDSRVYRVITLTKNEELVLDDLIAKDKTKTKTRIQQAEQKNCVDPGFHMVLQVNPVTRSGWSPFNPYNFLVTAVFAAGIQWEDFYGSAVLTAPSGLEGIWSSNGGASQGWLVGSLGQGPEAHFLAQLFSKAGFFSSGGWRLSVTGNATFPNEDSQGRTVCAGVQSVTQVFEWTGSSIIDHAAPPPA